MSGSAVPHYIAGATAGTAITDGKTTLAGIVVGNGTGAGTLTLHDSTAADNPVLAIECVANSTVDVNGLNMRFSVGIYAVITGANMKSTILVQ